MYRKLFIAFNAAMLVSLALAFVVDYHKDWRKYQQEYYSKTAASLEAKAAQASDPAQAQKLRNDARKMKHMPIVVHQIIAKDLGRVDRCVTCHVGMDEFVNPTLITEFKEHPFEGHPDISGIVKSHPFQKFGCTSCHAGQGLATDMKDAHGDVENWEHPMLKGPLIQANCAKCHADFETLRGAEVVAKGKHLFDTHGCIGCHKIHGVGGEISVDLGNVADKPLERIAPYNLSLVKTADGKPLPKEDWKLPAWIEAHLTNVPMDFIPNDPFAQLNKEPIAPSAMPDFTHELTHDDADAVTAYLLSLTDDQVPNRYYVPGPPKTEPKFAGAVEHGKFVFNKYGCAGCHGLGGSQGRRNYNALGPGQPSLDDVKNDPKKLGEAMAMGREPTLVDVLGTYTRDELRAKIQTGVPGSQVNKYNADGPTPPGYMPSWREKIKGQELEDLLTYLLSIGKKQEEF